MSAGNFLPLLGVLLGLFLPLLLVVVLIDAGHGRQSPPPAGRGDRRCRWSPR